LAFLILGGFLSRDDRDHKERFEHLPSQVC